MHTHVLNIDKTRFDFPSLLERINGDEEFALELLQMGIDSIEERIPMLQTLFDMQNWAELSNVSHALKGVSKNLSFNVLGQKFHSLEKLTKFATGYPGARAPRIHVLVPRVGTLIREIESEFEIIKQLDLAS